MKADTSTPKSRCDEDTYAESREQSHRTNAEHHHAALPIYATHGWFGLVAEDRLSESMPSQSVDFAQGNDSGNAATISELLDLALNAAEASSS